MRTKKALYNILGQIGYEVVAAICGLIILRLILSAFGSSYNGMVSSITQFLEYISILTLGISGSTRVALYKAKSKDDVRAESAILKATEIYMRKVALAFVVYTAALTIIYPYIVRTDFQWIESASLVVIIALGTFAEYFFGITYRTYLMASQSMYVYNIIQIFSKIANTLMSVVLIKLGCTIQIVKLGSAVCFVASPIILNYVVRKKYGIIKDVEPDNSALKQRGNVMAHSIANIVHRYTDIFVLTLFTSTEVVSVYFVYTLVLGTLRKMQNVFTTGMEAAFGELWARGEKDKFEFNLNIFEYLVFAFASVVFSCAALMILPFIKIYTKGVTDINYLIPSFALLSVAAYAMQSLRTPYLIAVQAAGKYKETRNGAFVEAGLNLGLSVLMVFKLGIIGVTIGTLAANTFRTVQYAVYLHKNLLDRNFSKFIKRFVWLAINNVIIYALKYILPSFDIDNWTQWMISGFYYFAIAVIVTITTSLIFYREDLTQGVVVAKRMLAHKITKKK